jgi:hypothetical protein
MDQVGKKQRITSRDPVSNLAFEVTLKKLRSSGSTCRTDASGAPSSREPGARDQGQPDLRTTNFSTDQQGRLAKLDTARTIDSSYTVQRIVKWQTKIVSKQEVCCALSCCALSCFAHSYVCAVQKLL